MGKTPGLRHVDAAIIGGGLTGYLLGASLADAGLQVAILTMHGEDEPPVRDTASLLCGPLFSQIQKAHGLDAARIYALHLQDQLRALTASSLPYVQTSSAYAFALNADESALLMLQQDLLSSLSLPIRIAPDAGGCPFPVELSLVMPGQALVDVAQWMSALQSSIRRMGGMIFSGVRNLCLDSLSLQTDQGRLDAQHIILTTNKPIGLRSKRLLSLLESRLLMHCALESPWAIHSFQQSAAGDFQLIPSPTGAIAAWDLGRLGTRALQRGFKAFQPLLSARLPDWQDGKAHYFTQVFPADGLPVIGALSGTRLLFACGLGSCRILGAMHAADVLTRRLLSRTKPEDRIYEPDRTIPQALLNRSAARNTLRYGANILRPNAPACPHCGCRMRYFNPAQRWECPWCGSAYSILGLPLCGPTTQSARVSARQRPI